MVNVTQAFLKVLFYMKIFSNYGFLVQMIKQSVLDIQGFLVFFMIWILFFSIQFKILDAEFDGGDYPLMPKTLQLIFITFRNSIGDLGIPGYEKFIARYEGGKNTSLIIITLIWVMWIMNIALMLIVLMNFLIAIISESYAAVMEAKTQYVYKDKAEMNLEC